MTPADIRKLADMLPTQSRTMADLYLSHELLRALADVVDAAKGGRTANQLDDALARVEDLKP